MATEIKSKDDPEGSMGSPGYRMPNWFPIRHVSQTQLAVVSLVVVVMFVFVSVVPFALGWISEDTLERLGIPGIFLANVISTASLIPLPGSAAIGQALIVAGASELWIPGVFVAALLGMAIGESTAYLAGSSGRHLARDSSLPFGDTRLGRWAQTAGDRIAAAMSEPRRAFAITAFLSGVPNPFFDVVGITAGATRMNFWLFILAVALGDVFRIALLIWVGDEFVDVSEILGG